MRKRPQHTRTNRVLKLEQAKAELEVLSAQACRRQALFELVVGYNQALRAKMKAVVALLERGEVSEALEKAKA